MGKSNTTEEQNGKEQNGKKQNHKESSKEPDKKKNVAIGTPYDDAFRTMLAECSGLLIPIINEVFGKHYSGSERIVFRQNEHFLNHPDGDMKNGSLIVTFPSLEFRKTDMCLNANQRQTTL